MFTRFSLVYIQNNRHVVSMSANMAQFIMRGREPGCMQVNMNQSHAEYNLLKASRKFTKFNIHRIIHTFCIHLRCVHKVVCRF